MAETNKWQTIDRAPRDGKRIIISDGHAMAISWWEDHFYEKWVSDGPDAKKRIIYNRGEWSGRGIDDLTGPADEWVWTDVPHRP